MQRNYIATGLGTTERYLRVYVTAHVGTTIRFIEVKVPWRMVAGRYREIVDGCEQVFLEAIHEQEDALQGRIPGID